MILILGGLLATPDEGRAQSPRIASPLTAASPSPFTLPAGPGSSRDQFQRYRARQMQFDRLAPPDNSSRILEAPRPRANATQCVPVTRLVISGVHHLNDALLSGIALQATRGGIGRCLSVADFNQILDQINDAYVKAGLVTSRAYLPQQSRKNGQLIITGIEGELAGFTFEGVGARHHELAAFPKLKGHFLNLRDLEQGMD